MIFSTRTNFYRKAERLHYISKQSAWRCGGGAVSPSDGRLESEFNWESSLICRIQLSLLFMLITYTSPYITLSQSVNLSNLWQIMWRMQCDYPVFQNDWDERTQACCILNLYSNFKMSSSWASSSSAMMRWQLSLLFQNVRTNYSLFYEWSKDDSVICQSHCCQKLTG